MKSVLLSVRPEWVAKILNGEKTIEIRKKFPKDYVGWVYIYCTKNEKEIVFGRKQNIYLCDMRGKTDSGFDFMTLTDDEDSEKFVKDNLNGKVVARFWCDKVEYVENTYDEFRWGEEDYNTETLNPDKLYEKSCLSFEEMDKYLQGDYGYAIHITDVQPFDEPKEIKEFRRYCDKHFNWWTNKCLGCKAYTPDTDIEDYCNKNKLALTRAPQSWCYVEI